jgi:hypothetical protein
MGTPGGAADPPALEHETGSVYAFRSELDSWQHTRTRQVPAEEDRSAASVTEHLGPDLDNGSPSPVPSLQHADRRWNELLQCMRLGNN